MCGNSYEEFENGTESWTYEDDEMTEAACVEWSLMGLPFFIDASDDDEESLTL